MLLECGHPNAKSYTLGMVELEAGIIAERQGREAIGQAALTRLAISSIPNQSVDPKSTRKSAKAFDELLKGMA